MLGYHVRLRPKNSDHLGSTREERRLIARSVLTRGRDYNLASFGLGEQHLHMYPFCDRDGAGKLAHRVELSLGLLLPLEGGFGKPYIEPIRDMAHAYNTFTYQLKQERRHGVPADRRGEGSNLSDLLGLRVVGFYTVKNVQRFLPRIDRFALLEIMGLRDLEPATGPLDLVIEAGLAAAALPSIRGRGGELTRLRRALLAIYDGRLVEDVVAAELAVSRRTLRRLRSMPIDPPLVRAIRLQLAAWGRF